MPTYTAIWTDTKQVIYANVPPGNRFGRLPLGAMPKKFPGDMLNRRSGDEWDGALFGCEGREILVTRDPEAGSSLR